MSSTSCPISARQAPRDRHVVVLATPPFWLPMAMATVMAVQFLTVIATRRTPLLWLEHSSQHVRYRSGRWLLRPGRSLQGHHFHYIWSSAERGLQQGYGLVTGVPGLGGPLAVRCCLRRWARFTLMPEWSCRCWRPIHSVSSGFACMKRASAVGPLCLAQRACQNCSFGQMQDRDGRFPPQD